MRQFPVRLVCGGALAATVLGSLLLPPRPRAEEKEPDWSKISFKVEKVGGSVYMIHGEGGFSGGNIAVSVGDDGILLVDDSFSPLAPKLQAALKGLADRPVKVVINTHFHGDHSNGNVVFGPIGTVVAHENTRSRLTKDGFFGKAAPASALPVVTFEDKVAVHFNGDDIRVQHYPAAHTDSDVTVVFPQSKVVHLGDLFFNGMYPFIDTEHGGSVRGYAAMVDKALREVPADARVIPGHGPLAGRKELEAYAEMLRESLDVVARGVAAGKTLDELKKAHVLAKFDAAWGKGFLKTDEWIEELYNGLKR